MNKSVLTQGELWAERADEYDNRVGRLHMRSIILAPPLRGSDEPEPIAYVDAESDVRFILALPKMYAEVVLFAAIARLESANTRLGGWDWKGIHERLTVLLAETHGEQPPVSVR